jgi:UPF0755 protein
VTLVEGWNFRQVRAALAKERPAEARHARAGRCGLMAQLGRPGVHPEGRFFPDTYTYAKGSSDLKVLQRAMRRHGQALAAAWAQRTPQAVVKTADEALILASIVEKETGKAPTGR